MAGKQYASVSEMLHDIDPEFAAEFDAGIAKRTIVKELLILRALKGYNQLDIAHRSDLVVNQISALENGTDADARLGDLRAYANAVGCDLEVRLVPKEQKEESDGE